MPCPAEPETSYQVYSPAKNTLAFSFKSAIPEGQKTGVFLMKADILLF
jgi:hypothetical protein